jgi:Na+-transporting NADH:ubiquinone oxidoreductase subunit C
MQRSGTVYTLVFATIVCVVCSILVCAAAVGLKTQQERNALVFMQSNVLSMAGAVSEDEKLRGQQVLDRFDERIRIRLVDLETGDYAPNEAELLEAGYDLQRAMADPETSRRAPDNLARVPRLPQYAPVYQVMDGENVAMLILPVQGKGLWSTLYGFLALAPDTNTIEALTFFKHGETPGLGGEVDNPAWKAKWRDRKAYDSEWQPAIEVVKGQAGPSDTAPHQMDGLSGATITSRSVQHLLNFWLGENGFGPYLAKYREQGSKA